MDYGSMCREFESPRGLDAAVAQWKSSGFRNQGSGVRLPSVARVNVLGGRYVPPKHQPLGSNGFDLQWSVGRPTRFWAETSLVRFQPGERILEDVEIVLWCVGTIFVVILAIPFIGMWFKSHDK